MGNARIYRFTVRLSPNEQRALRILAARENVVPGEFIRILLREGAERRGLHSIGLIALLGFEGAHNEPKL